MFVGKAAVVGGGIMGAELAQSIAAAGFPVVIKDISTELAEAAGETAREVTKRQLDRLVVKEKLSAKQAEERLQQVMAKVSCCDDYGALSDVDLVVEAVPEEIELKKRVFGELDLATPGHAILASNTSALSIGALGAATLRPAQVVGLHFFFPVSLMPLAEVIAGSGTSRATVTTAHNFAQAIGKQPITCRDSAGFVVNRILMAAAGEVWRLQEEGGLAIAKIDEAFAAAGAAPVGPFRLTDLAGLDTALCVAEHLQQTLGEDFYVHGEMRDLVAAGKLGAKSGDSGFYKDGEATIPAAGEPDAEELLDLFSLRMLVEACRILEQRLSSLREIDLGLIAGAGFDPRRGLLPPFWKADLEGLDTVLAKLERYEQSHGRRFAPPLTLRRLVAQGRLGPESGRGFYAYPQTEGDGTVKLERRGEVALAWLANPPLNAVSADVIRDLRAVWDEIKADPGLRAMVLCSALPIAFSAGADIKGFADVDDPSQGAELLDRGHELLKEFGRGEVATVAAVNGLAYGAGCELAQACDFRVAADSAVFGQPEINLGIVPGFGGTQRLPRLIGRSKALAMNLSGAATLAPEALEQGLADDLAHDEDLLDVAISWARMLAGQAPLALKQIKEVADSGDLDQGIEAEKTAFVEVFFSEDGREGIAAFLTKRQPSWSGR